MKKIMILVLSMVLVLTGCGTARSEAITIVGSSTVYPITLEAQAEYLEEVDPNAVISIESNGTGGGFELFVQNQAAINDASRAINDEEKAKAEANGVEYTEYNIGVDGITVIINKENDWAQKLTSEQLKEAFELGSDITYWSDLDPSFPQEKINFYGPTSASGTYDFFVETILGDKEGALRDDMAATENDNEIVTNIEKDKYGIGFLGYSYYSNNQDSIQDIEIDGISPTIETIKSGEYILSRPLFIYVNNLMMEENESLKSFVGYYLENSQTLVEKSGYVPLSDEEQEALESSL